MTEQTPSPEALDAARKIAAEIDVEHDDVMQAECSVCKRVIPFIALALDRFAERRGEREINRLRRRVNNYHAWIASLDTGAHLDPPEPEDG